MTGRDEPPTTNISLSIERQTWIFESLATGDRIGWITVDRDGDGNPIGSFVASYRGEPNHKFPSFRDARDYLDAREGGG